MRYIVAIFLFTVSLSYLSPFGLKTDGTIWAWGANNYGQAGQNSTNNGYSSPVQVGSGTDWAAVREDVLGMYARKTDGTFWVWGHNNFGQLGQNNRTDYSSPVQIPGTWLGQPGGGNKVAMMYKDA